MLTKPSFFTLLVIRSSMTSRPWKDVLVFNPSLCHEFFYLSRRLPNSLKVMDQWRLPNSLKVMDQSIAYLINTANLPFANSHQKSFKVGTRKEFQSLSLCLASISRYNFFAYLEWGQRQLQSCRRRLNAIPAWSSSRRSWKPHNTFLIEQIIKRMDQQFWRMMPKLLPNLIAVLTFDRRQTDLTLAVDLMCLEPFYNSHEMTHTHMLRSLLLVKSVFLIGFVYLRDEAIVTLPQDWHIMEKSLAIAGGMPRASVMTGNATAPPPSEVAPPISAPKIMVMDK